MRLLITGHRTFSNRGCEAIIRSTVGGLRRVYGDVEVLVPSDDISRDSAQWPEAREYGVVFVPAYSPIGARYWVNAQRLPFPMLKRAGWPFPLPRWLKDQIRSADAVISVGGDNYSLDYRLPSLLQGMDGFAIAMGVPVIVWGASVGPFEREPSFVPAISEHLSRMSQIFVRETISFNYLTQELGLDNVERMVDPAFTLEPSKIDTATFWPKHQGAGLIGLNLSPLVERYKHLGQDLRGELTRFVRRMVTEQGFGVLLVPHVIPLDGSRKNNDESYMRDILDECRDIRDSVKMIPASANASEIKYIVGRLRFFIGARTHATIAALSSGVPTLSISYSVKARGINRDLFGSEEMVLATPELSCQSLLEKMKYLLDNEEHLVKRLTDRIPEYHRTVEHAAESLRVAG